MLHPKANSHFRRVSYRNDIKNCSERQEEKPGAGTAAPWWGLAACLPLCEPVDFPITSDDSLCDLSAGSGFVDQYFLLSETEAKPDFRGEQGR